MEPPICRLCGRRHWLRENCAGKPHAEKLNISREGRRVLKGSTGKGSPAKPTRSESESADPPKPAKAPAERAIGEKPAGGTAKPRRRKKGKR